MFQTCLLGVSRLATQACLGRLSYLSSSPMMDQIGAMADLLNLQLELEHTGGRYQKDSRPFTLEGGSTLRPQELVLFQRSCTRFLSHGKPQLRLSWYLNRLRNKGRGSRRAQLRIIVSDVSEVPDDSQGEGKMSAILASIFANPKTTLLGLLFAVANAAVLYFQAQPGGWAYIGSALVMLLGFFAHDPKKPDPAVLSK